MTTLTSYFSKVSPNNGATSAPSHNDVNKNSIEVPSSTQTPSLTDGTAKEISQYLLEQRFKNNGKDTATFVLKILEHLPENESISSTIANWCKNKYQSQRSTIKDEISQPIQQKHQTTSLKNNNQDNTSITTNQFVKHEPIILPNSDHSNKDQSTSILLSATMPRGRFNLQIYPTGMQLSTVQTSKDTDNNNNNALNAINILASQVQHIILFPKPEDCRKTSSFSNRKSKQPQGIPGSMVLITFQDSSQVQFRNKTLKQVCFQLPTHFLHNNDSNNHGDDEEEDFKTSTLKNDPYEDEWSQLLQNIFQRKVIRIMNSVYFPQCDDKRKNIFKSDDGDGNTSTTTGGLPYVKCHSGVQDGVLFPLEDGLLFFKPPRFIHRSQLHSIGCSPGGKYFSLDATLEDVNEDNNGKGEVVSFSNIASEERTVMNSYIHKILVPAMQRDATNPTSICDTDLNTMDESSSLMIKDVSIISNDTVEEDDTNTIGMRKRSRRAASIEARRATQMQLESLEKKKEEKGVTNHDYDDDEDDEDGDYFMSGEGVAENATDDDEHSFDDSEDDESDVADDLEETESEEDEVDDDDDDDTEHLTKRKRT